MPTLDVAVKWRERFIDVRSDLRSLPASIMGAGNSPRPGTPIVGRDRERETLLELLDNADGGSGNAIFVSGDAGIGKTTLVSEFGRIATEHGARILTGNCYDLAVPPPYGPWVDILRAAGTDPDLPPAPELLGSADERNGDIGRAPNLESVISYLTSLAKRQLLVLVLEDMHWSDPASLDVLHVVSSRLSDQRLLVVVTYRDALVRQNPLYQALPDLIRDSQARRLELRPLGNDDTRALVAALYRLNSDDQDRLTDFLHLRTEGNPFFISELLHTLESEGVLRQSDDGWCFSDHEQTPVPALIRQLIDGRVDKLGHDVRVALELLAVIGEKASYRLWHSISRLEETTLTSLIGHALDAQLVVEAPDGMGFRFTHALVQETLYLGLMLPQRRQIHLQVAEALLHEPYPDPDAVAYHLQQAVDERAAEWLIRAGKRAMAANAYLTAFARFEDALALDSPVSREPATRAELLLHLGRIVRLRDPHLAIEYLAEAVQLADQVEDTVLAAVARFRLGYVRRFAGQLRWGLADLERSLDILDALPAEDESRVASLDAAASVGARHAAFASGLAAAGRLDHALEQIERAQTERQYGHSSDLPTTLGWVQAGRGRPEQARAAFARAREQMIAGEEYEVIILLMDFELLHVILPYFSDQLRQWRLEATQLLARAQQTLGKDLPRHIDFLPLLVHEGRWDEARTLALEARADAHANYQIIAKQVLAPLALRQGDLELAHVLMEQALPAGREAEPGDNGYLMTLRAQRLAVELALNEGDLAAAREWLEINDRWLAWNDCVLGRAERELLWGQYHRATNNLVAARERAEQALNEATKPRQPLSLLAAHRFLGELAIEEERHSTAEEHLRVSLSLAERCGAPYERALGLTALAGLYASIGKAPEAASLLDAARNICRPLGAAPALARIDSLAAGLASEATGMSEEYPAGLSEREVDVLRLMAAGWSNREIAAELFISERTVERHITNLYTKIGARGRAAAANFALQHNLT